MSRLRSLGVVLIGLSAITVTFLFVRVSAFDCCVPALLSSMAARFAQGAQVTVYLDSSSGFTSDELTLITDGIESWNNVQSNAGITFTVVVTNSPPAPGTHNTVVGRYNDVHSNSAVAALTMHQDGDTTYGTLVFNKNIREGNEALPAVLRTTARHEMGHGQGLDNAYNCPGGSTVMNPSPNEETYVTPCDVEAINSVPTYPSTPTPTPACTQLQFSCSTSPECCSGFCGEWNFVCMDCLQNPQEPSERCMSQACTSCYSNGGVYCTGTGGNCWTPILVDVNGDGFVLTNAKQGVNFDDGNGTILRTAWTVASGDDAWLVLDRDGNGAIDNGTELFGNAAPQPPVTPGQLKNGFRALEQFDIPANGGNGDRVLDQQDSIFGVLRLWQDFNHNGISEPAELHSLPDLGLRSISLVYKEAKRRDANGNTFRYRAKVVDTNGTQLGRWVYDVFLQAKRAS